MCIQEVQLKSRLQHAETYQPQQERPTASVVPQQYSSTAFVSLRFQSRKKKYGARIINITTSQFLPLHRAYWHIHFTKRTTHAPISTLLYSH
jgi:hypothetical protein